MTIPANVYRGVMASKRLRYYDNIKFFLITTVVIGHAIDSYAVPLHRMAQAAFVFIYSFHMPLFIFLSGLFVTREKLNARYVKSKAVFFVMMGFVAKLLMQLLSVIRQKPVGFRLLGDDGVPWYMFAMAAFYVLAYLLKERKGLPVLVLTILVGAFVGYDESIGDYLYLSRVVVFFPFFWAGVITSSAAVEERTKGTLPKVVGAIAVAAFAYACVFHTGRVYSYRYLFTGRNYFARVAIEDCSWVNRIQAYLITCWMMVGILALFPHGEIPVISRSGERTLQVYLMHRPIVRLYQIYGILEAIDALPGPGWLLVFPLAIATALVCATKLFQIPFEALCTSLREEDG